MWDIKDNGNGTYNYNGRLYNNLNSAEMDRQLDIDREYEYHRRLREPKETENQQKPGCLSPALSRGVPPNRSANSSFDSESHHSEVSSIGLYCGAKRGFVVSGALRLYGHTVWHSSQPKIQPWRGVFSPSPSRSIVAHDIQRDVSICRSFTALFGQASTHRRHSPHPTETSGTS